MPDQNNSKTNSSNSAVVEPVNKNFLIQTSGRINQEKAYQILSQGVVLTMEDDLKTAQQEQKIKADLIPGQTKPELSPALIEQEPKEIFSPKPYFDPFASLKETEVKVEPQVKEVIVQEKILAPELVPAKVNQDLEARLAEVSLELKKINEQINPILQNRNALLERLKLQELAVEKSWQKAQPIKEQQRQIEQKEQVEKNSEQKMAIEQQRWETEEKFREAEELRWAHEEELEKIQGLLSKISKDLKDLKDKKNGLEQEQIEIQKFLNNKRLLKDKEEIFAKNKEIFAQKPKFQETEKELQVQKEKIEKEILLITQEEQIIEQQTNNLEKQIQQITDSKEKRKLEQELWQIAQKRHNQEKARWEAENRKKETDKRIEEVKEKIVKLQQEEDVIMEKTKEIEAQVSVGNIPPEPPKQEPVLLIEPKVEDLEAIAREKEAIEKIRLEAKKKEQEIVQTQVVQKQINQEAKETALELRQRQEEENRQEAIRKLKQIAEQEQKKESLVKLKGPVLKEEILKKLTKVSLQEETQRKDFLLRISNKAKKIGRLKPKSFEQGVVFHPMIRKVSVFEKVAVRLFFVFLIGAIAFGIYFGVSKIKENKNSQNIAPNQATTTSDIQEWPNLFPDNTTTTQQATTSDEGNFEIDIDSSMVMPVSLIPTSNINYFAFGELNKESVSSSTKNILDKEILRNNFEQIIVSGLTAPEFFQVLGAVLPQEVFQTASNTMAVVFSGRYGNRLGFILQTNATSALSKVFRSWESQAESNTADIFGLMGKTDPALVNFFKTIHYKGVSIRFQTFTKQDLGVCYATYKNYFIFTSSLEQMDRIVDKLP